MMSIKGNSNFYFYLAVIVAMLIVIIASLQYEDFESKLLPIFFASLVLIIAAIGAGQIVLTGKHTSVRAGEESKEEPAFDDDIGEWRSYLPIGLWLIGFAVIIYLLGFVIAIPLFLILYMKMHRSSWVSIIIVTVVVSALIYGVFELALGIELYRGIIFPELL